MLFIEICEFYMMIKKIYQIYLFLIIKELFIILINLLKKNKTIIIFKIVKFHSIKINRNFINYKILYNCIIVNRINIRKILEIKLY